MPACISGAGARSGGVMRADRAIDSCMPHSEFSHVRRFCYKLIAAVPLHLAVTWFHAISPSE